MVRLDDRATSIIDRGAHEIGWWNRALSTPG
jgi:hypothetical protein